MYLVTTSLNPSPGFSHSHARVRCGACPGFLRAVSLILMASTYTAPSCISDETSMTIVHDRECNSSDGCALNLLKSRELFPRGISYDYPLEESLCFL